jgi:hypothetical protein
MHYILHMYMYMLPQGCSSCSSTVELKRCSAQKPRPLPLPAGGGNAWLYHRYPHIGGAAHQRPLPHSTRPPTSTCSPKEWIGGAPGPHLCASRTSCRCCQGPLYHPAGCAGCSSALPSGWYMMLSMCPLGQGSTGACRPGTGCTCWRLRSTGACRPGTGCTCWRLRSAWPCRRRCPRR